MDDFTAAIERIVAGLEKKNRLLEPARARDRRAPRDGPRAGRRARCPAADPVHKVSIIPRGIGALGYTMQRPTEDRYLMTREELEQQAGGAARRPRGRGPGLRPPLDRRRRRSGQGDRDRAQHGDALRDGAGARPRDLRRRADRARLGTPRPALRAARYSEATAREIDCAVRELVDRAFTRARAILDPPAACGRNPPRRAARR